MLFLYSCWYLLNMQRDKGRLLTLLLRLREMKRKAWGQFSHGMPLQKELAPAQEGFSLLVFAPTNLQLFAIMDHITTNSCKGRRRSGSMDLTTKSLNSGCHSPNCWARFPQAHTVTSECFRCGALGISLTLAHWFVVTQKFPVGSVVIVGFQALNRGDVGTPWALHHCETVGTVNGLQEITIFKGNSIRAFIKL